MKLQIETPAFNARRYGKPWIAKIDFHKISEPGYQWGDWIGDARNGSAGLLEIDLEPGDVFARGQKDNRKQSNSAPDFYQFLDGGKRIALGNKAEALKAWRDNELKKSETSLPL